MGSHSQHRAEGRGENCEAAGRQQWTKGFLQNEEAKLGDEVTVKTAVGRLVEGTLIDEAPCYTHSYGKFVPEIIEIDRQLREIMNFGGEA